MSSATSSLDESHHSGDNIWNETRKEQEQVQIQELPKSTPSDETHPSSLHCLLDYWFSTRPSGVHCDAVWDGYECWPATPANKTIVKPCPILILGLPSDSVAHRTCTAEGVWLNGNWTNYTMCIPNIDDNMNYDYWPELDPNAVLTALWIRDTYFCLCTISCVLLLITLFIFCHFKALQCPRISIHKNLVISFILRYIFIIIILEPFVFGRVGQTPNSKDTDWICKLLIILVNYSTIANTAWMLVEGLFLHSRVAVSVFKKTMPYRLYFCIGWVLPVPVVTSWALCMLKNNTRKCWHGWSEFSFVWIIFGPIIIFLMLNFIFLINIIRIVVTKLRTNENTVELNNIRKAVRATALLFPLLGLTNVFYLFPPNSGSGQKRAYRVTNAILHSSQGIFVSIIHCFLNTEVRSAIGRRWSQFVVRRVVRQSQRRSSTARSSVFTSTSNQGLTRKEVFRLLAAGGIEHRPELHPSPEQQRQQQ